MEDSIVSNLSDFGIRGRASVLIDGQFGSTGKGLIAACIGMCQDYHITTTNASANAGHTAILPNGDKFITYHLPMSGLMNGTSLLYLNVGSIIDPDLLMTEIEKFNLEPDDRLFIHPMATIITEEDKEYERKKSSGTTKISSTQKGVGRALARRAMREGKVAKDVKKLKGYIKDLDLNYYMRFGKKVMVEIPQGLSLSNQGPFYPYCTSRPVTVGHALADAGIHPNFLGNVMMSIRSFPIRVGNIPGGYSGDCYVDQNETTWEEIGVDPEYTTVTKRMRRVFTFSEQQYSAGLSQVRPTHIFGNFANYFKSYEEFTAWREALTETEMKNSIIVKHLWGMGPSTDDVVGLEGAGEWFKTNYST